MPTRTISRRVMRRFFIIAVLIAVIFAGLGYWLAPSRPYIFVHLPRGGYISEYATQAECSAARKGFAAGRGIDTSSALTISWTYVNLCSANIRDLNAGP